MFKAHVNLQAVGVTERLKGIILHSNLYEMTRAFRRRVHVCQFHTLSSASPHQEMDGCCLCLFKSIAACRMNFKYDNPPSDGIEPTGCEWSVSGILAEECGMPRNALKPITGGPHECIIADDFSLVC